MIKKWFSNLFKKSKPSTFISDGSFKGKTLKDLYRLSFTQGTVYSFFCDNEPSLCRSVLFGDSQRGLIKRLDRYSQATISKFEKDYTTVSFDIAEDLFIYYKWHIDNGNY